MICSQTILATLAVASITLHAADFDVIIRNGRIIDGTGNPSVHADLGISHGKIAAIGKIAADANANRKVDASGLVIAPGFIDVHTHAEDIFDLPLAENFVRMGVTSVVMGNCGSSVLDVGEFFRKFERNHASINVATLIGHGTVRREAMHGSFDGVPTTDELGRMKALVQKAMEDGAFGLSTGLIYLPGTFSKTEEIIELAKVASHYDGIYATHMRDEGRGMFTALEETFRIGREAHIRVEVSHIKLSAKPMWGRAAEAIALIEKARAQGLDVTHDQYVYTASSTGLGQLIPDQAREGGKFKERISNPDFKTKLITEMKENLTRNQRDDYSYAFIANCSADKSLNGLNVPDAARKSLNSSDIDAQIALILDIEARGGASAIFHGIDEKDLQTFLAHPNTMIASDSGVRKFNEGVPHPRGYGNNARVFARYVRELKVLRLEDAARRMTSLPAQTFHLKDRGVLREGAWADVVIFDPERIQDEARFESPHHYATGIVEVFVNGVEVVKNDKHTEARPGMSLRLGR